LGVYWPLLMEKRLVRMNGSRLARPKLPECHIFTWLLPRQSFVSFPRSAFFLASDARDCINEEGLSWLSTFSQPAIALSLLKQRDWAIFSTNPMVRNLGSRTSTMRLLLLFALAQLLDRKAEAQEHLIQARAAIEHCPKHLRPRFYDWMDCIDL
jgi:hypothetical protein